MGKQTAESGQQQAPDQFQLGLDEFCARLSNSDTRVELIAGFHADEASKGRMKGFESDYRSRFEVFAKRPTK